MKYQVLTHKYMNTGGNCMVSIFQLYDTEEHKTVFLLVNEEGGELATADFIGQELDFEPEMHLDLFDIHELDETNKNFELYRDCWFEYVKRDCKYFGISYNVPWKILPKKYYDTLTADDIAQLEENKQHHIIFNSADGSMWIG